MNNTDKTKGFSFKRVNKNVLSNKEPVFKKANSKMGRKPKSQDEMIVKKVLLTLTASEYEKFKQAHIESGFPSESSFLKFRAKQNDII